MSDHADPDYESTLDEIHEVMRWFSESDPGHGNITMVPVMADRIWDFPNVWWANRRVRDDGMIDIDWMIPERLPH